MRTLTFITGVFLFSMVACTKISTTELGSGLIPTVDGVNTFDTTLEIITENVVESDTTRVYKFYAQALGIISNDPIFGKTSANLFFQLMPAYFPFSITGTSDSIKVDSAVLILSCKSFYGDSTLPLKINVEEISTNTPLDPFKDYPANYPSLSPFSTVGSIANTKEVDIRRLRDSVYNRFEASNYQIRIRLHDSFAKRFIKEFNSTNAYKSDTTFRENFGGFSLKVEAGNTPNALLYISLADTNTKLALYYNSSTTGATTRDTVVTNFRFSSFTCGNANFVTRNRTGSELANHISTPAKPDSLVYLQTSPGNYVRIKIPGLKNFSNSIIHRAELITEQVPDNNNFLTLDKFMAPPSIVLLSAWDSANSAKINVPNDYVLSSSGAPNTVNFGGYLSYKSVPGFDNLATYNFNLSRYVQGIVSRKDQSYELRLSAPVNDSLSYKNPYPSTAATQTIYLSPSVGGNNVADGRVRLGGGNHSRFKMRLRIVYSRI
jgi:hypothetical protein